MKQFIFFRAASLCIAVALASVALFDITATMTRPRERAAYFLFYGAPIPQEPNTIAASLSLDGTIRADVATIQALRVIGQLSGMADQSANTRAAQNAVISCLKLSPIDSPMWMTLGLLQAQLIQPTGPALKNSYLTGPIPGDTSIRRLRAVLATDAVNDEDIRLLAQLDVKIVLTEYPRLEPALATAFRESNQTGRMFLLEATEKVDPRFSQVLREYQQ